MPLPLGKQSWTFGLWVVVLLLGLSLSPGEAGGMIGLYNGSPVISFGHVDPALPPVVVTGGTQLLIISPQDRWTLSIEARGDLVNRGQPEVQIPASRLSWAVNDGGVPNWTPLEAYTSQTVYGPAEPTEKNGQLIRIDYRLSPSWDDPPLPWEYTTELCFTLSPDLEPLHSWVHPTPFIPDGNSLLTIGYWVPGSGPSAVEVRITDADGTVVKVLSAVQEGGKWQEIAWDGRIVADSKGTYEFIRPGVYYYEVVLLPAKKTIAAGIIEVAYHRYAGQGRVHGRILRADTGEALPGAQIVLYTRERRQAAVGITGEDGTYRLEYLPAGEYYLEASLPGYLPAVSDLFYLDGYEERQISLKLLPNRALDLDLQLSTKTVEVGELLWITLRLTNSGTKDLLGAVVEVLIPQGFAYVGGKAARGRIGIDEKDGARGSGTKLKWEAGPLRQGESLQAEVWVLAGLDVLPRSAKVQAQAAGFTEARKLDTGRISRLVEVTSGGFIAASPRTTIDAHLSIPLAKQASLELRLEPDSAAAYPGPPFGADQEQGKQHRNPLVSTAEPLTITLGDLPPHGLRIRSEGVNWAVEGGSWRHFLPPGRLPIDELAIAGVQGALRRGDVVFRGFYGVPEAWPHFKLFPADNTSGPFALSKPLPSHGSVDVRVLSWDSQRGVWQEEAPVIYRVDYSRGTVTLGKAVSSHNARGDRQYILIIYTQSGPAGENIIWKEASMTLTKPKLEFMGSYVEVGDELGLKLAGIRGRFIDSNLILQGSLQTTLESTLVAGLEALVQDGSQGRQAPGDKSSPASRSAWQLIGAVEVYPGLRVGGGWGGEGREYTGFWGVTSQEGGGGASLVGSSLTRLVQNLWDQLSSSGPTAQLGMGPLALAEKESRRWALGMEVDLSENWWASFTAKKEESSGRIGNASGNQVGSLHGAKAEVSTGWEQRVTYEAEGLPRWSLGYGRKAAESFKKEQSHYGLIEADGKVENLEWRGRIFLIQNLAGDGGNRSLEGERPIQAVAELSAKYGGGRFRPRIGGRLGASLIGGDRFTQRDFQEWSIGLDGDINDHLKVSIAHTDRYRFSGIGGTHGVADYGISAAAKDSGSDTRLQPGIDDYSQAVSLSARYSKKENWSLSGMGEWVRDDGDNQPSWQGSMELETRLDSNLTLKLCWSGTEENLPFQGDTNRWLDRFTLTLSQEGDEGPWRKREVLLGASLEGTKVLAWDVGAEGTLRLEPWEIWTWAAVKSVESPLTGQLVTKQGVLRLSRRLKEPWSGFLQLGSWQQLDKAEIGCSLGVSCEVTQGFSITAGYTWPIRWEGSKGGYLSIQPGLFVQLFAR
ncbi:MAG: hypothetical protein GX063_06930 [Firmicutes bacterium]|nr:hypothetical protein [Bacillota bacterium]